MIQRQYSESISQVWNNLSDEILLRFSFILQLHHLIIHSSNPPYNLESIPSLKNVARLLSIPILRFYIIRKRLGLLKAGVPIDVMVIMMVVAMIMGVWIFGRPDVFHLVNAAAFGAALKGAIARYLYQKKKGKLLGHWMDEA